MEDRPTREEETKALIVSMLNADPPHSTHEILEALSARLKPRDPTTETDHTRRNRQIPFISRAKDAGC